MRRWRHIVLHVLFGIHSPSLLYVGRCWCQRKGVKAQLPTQEDIDQMIRVASQRAWRGWSE